MKESLAKKVAQNLKDGQQAGTRSKNLVKWQHKAKRGVKKVKGMKEEVKRDEYGDPMGVTSKDLQEAESKESCIKYS